MTSFVTARWNAARKSAPAFAVILAHSLLLFRIRIDALFSSLSRRPRVIATACWHFPIYSQTFVYRELTELTKRQFNVRFLYSELTSRNQLAEDVSILWRLKRRLILSDVTSKRDLEHYKRRMPDRVDAVARMIATAADMTPEEVMWNEHFRHAFSFTRMVECFRADYIHSYFFYERTLFSLVASSLLGIPRGVSCYADHMMKDYAWKLLPLQMESCDVVVATSARIKQELETLADRTLPHVVVKPNAIDSSQFPTAPRARTIKSSPCRIVTVSRIHPKKGLTYLIDAAEYLSERGATIVVRILGEPDAEDAGSVAYYEALKECIRARKLESIVRLEGRKSSAEVRTYLFDSDIFVAPFVELENGDKDGIPTALLEAMAAGCAIASTDAGSILEVINHGVEGLVVPQRDSLALANAMRALIEDGALRTRLSQAAIERVRREFDVRQCEAKFHERIHAAMGNGTPNAARGIAAA